MNATKESAANADPTGTLSAINASVELVHAAVKLASVAKDTPNALSSDAASSHSGSGQPESHATSGLPSNASLGPVQLILSPIIHGASRGQVTNHPGIGRGAPQGAGRGVSAASPMPLHRPPPQNLEPVEPEAQRRAFEKVISVLNTVGGRIMLSGLVDEDALARTLAQTTAHIEAQLLSLEDNKLLQSLGNKLADPQLINNVFTSIYLFAFLSSELERSLPRYKGAISPGLRMVQQLFKVALGLDEFKENLQANLAAYKTLITTASMLRPLDRDLSVFREFPSFTTSKFSSRSYLDRMHYKGQYEKLSRYFVSNGFPQPQKDRDVGHITDWLFLTGDWNTREYVLEPADLHIGENFGRVLYFLLCLANRLKEGTAVIAYHDQHVRLVRWFGSRFGYRVIEPRNDLYEPQPPMPPKMRAIFNTWVLIMPSKTLLQRRRIAAAAAGPDRAALQQHEATTMPPGVTLSPPPTFRQPTPTQRSDDIISSHLSVYNSNPTELDSGYGSVARSVRSRESSVHGKQGNELRPRAIDPHSYTEVSEDHDTESLASENDIIGSQVLAKETEVVLTDEALIGVFLRESSIFRTLCERALAKVDKQRFTQNLQRLFRSFYENLLTEAKSEREKAVAKLLRRRRARLSISQRLYEQIEAGHNLAEQDERLHLNIAARDNFSLEKQLAGVSDVPMDLPEQNFEGHDSDDESTEAETQNEFPFTSEIKRFLEDSESFKSLLRDFVLWLLPIDLRQIFLSIPQSCISISQEQDTSLTNWIKAWVEDSTKVNWNWWPLEARKRSLRNDESRLFWQCTCGKRQWMEISTEQYELVKEVLSLMSNIPPLPHWCRAKRLRLPLLAYLTGLFRRLPAASQATSSSIAASRYTPSSPAASTAPLAAVSQQSAIPFNSSSQQRAPHTISQALSIAQDTSSQIRNYILFGVQKGRPTIIPAQIPVYDQSTDASIFGTLRECYQARRGWLRLWFSIWRLENCAVVKFNRLSVNHMAHEYRDLPEQQEYIYAPRAGDSDAKNPPLSSHLFEALYYTCPTPCKKWIPHGCSSSPNGVTAVARLPKRAKCFQRDQTSPIWGIEAVFAISVAHVIVYHLVLVAGPFAFFGWWVGAHPLDLQNANVPATMAGGALSLLWMISGILTGKEID